eukprot:Filipodium_phascolosomae@DN3635_c0_g1_i1.p1
MICMGPPTRMIQAPHTLMDLRLASAQPPPGGNNFTDHKVTPEEAQEIFNEIFGNLFSRIDRMEQKGRPYTQHFDFKAQTRERGKHSTFGGHPMEDMFHNFDQQMSSRSYGQSTTTQIQSSLRPDGSTLQVTTTTRKLHNGSVVTTKEEVVIPANNERATERKNTSSGSHFLPFELKENTNTHFGHILGNILNELQSLQKNSTPQKVSAKDKPQPFLGFILGGFFHGVAHALGRAAVRIVGTLLENLSRRGPPRVR